MKQEIRTASAPAPIGPFSQGIRSGNRVYTAGQGPIDPATGAVVGETIEEQTAATLRNIEAILREAGATLNDVVKVNAFLSDLADFEAYNRVYRTFFAEPYPVRTTVGCQLLGIKVEIEVIAELGDERDGE